MAFVWLLFVSVSGNLENNCSLVTSHLNAFVALLPLLLLLCHNVHQYLEKPVICVGELNVCTVQ